MKINLSATFEKALAEIIKARQREEWLKSNKESRQNHLFSNDLRSF